MVSVSLGGGVSVDICRCVGLCGSCLGPRWGGRGVGASCSVTTGFGGGLTLQGGRCRAGPEGLGAGPVLLLFQREKTVLLVPGGEDVWGCKAAVSAELLRCLLSVVGLVGSVFSRAEGMQVL